MHGTTIKIIGRLILPDIITAVTELENEGKQLPSVERNVTKAATS